MNINAATVAITAARPVGRERTCTHCTTTYRSPRASRFCGDACRKKAQRRKVRAGHWMLRLLERADMVGPISADPPAIGLTVPNDFALESVNAFMARTGHAYLPASEFGAMLRELNVYSYGAEPVAARKRVLEAEYARRRRR
jgi:hypothetical protein